MLRTVLQWLGSAADMEVSEASGLAKLCMEQASHADKGVREALATNITCMARPAVLAAFTQEGSPQGSSKPDGLALLQVCPITAPETQKQEIAKDHCRLQKLAYVSPLSIVPDWQDETIREALAMSIICMACLAVLAALSNESSPQGSSKPDGLTLLQVSILTTQKQEIAEG